MYVGYPTLCLPATDLAASTLFYEALGLEEFQRVPDIRVVLRRGTLRLALMPFLSEPWLNFRGADVFALHEHLRAGGLALEGQPQRYERGRYQSDADGESWLTRDPAGHAVLFDTNRDEDAPERQPRRVAELLRSTEQELIDAGASAECLSAFRAELLAKFAADGG